VKLSLKSPFFFTLTILLLALIFPIFAQEKETLTPIIGSQSTYRVGERLTYNVSFANFPSAAHVEVEVVARGVFFGRDAIQLRAHVETTGVINVALFAINNDYVSYVDPETGLPFRTEQSARDAIRTASAVQDFNQPAGGGSIPAKQRGFPGTYDLVSAFFRARTLPLADGAVYNFFVRGEGNDYAAELKVVGRDIVRTNVGSFPCIVTHVKLNTSLIKNLKVYFSDDERHVPVLMTARVSTGEITAELAGSEIVTPPAETPTPTPAVIAAPIPAPTKPNPTTLDPDSPFDVGEQLNYQIFLGSNNTPMGVANFQVRGRSKYFERDGVYLSVNAETTGAAAQLFVAKDRIESYVDPTGLLPYRTVLNLEEGQRRLNEVLTLSQEAGIATSDRGARIEIPVGTHDYLSFFYALRTFNLNPPKKSAVSMLVEKKPMTLFVDAVKRETIQLGDRRVPAIALAITTDDTQSDKYQLRMWVSDDRRRLPLRITGVTEIGPLRADLAILPTAVQ
jgi:hypothetical protein